MAPRLISDEQLLERLTGLFRDRGFDSASLSEIATATGLQKSSLYHRFPGGKEQMAAEVARATGAHVGEVVLAPLRTSASPRAALRQVARNLDAFYESGDRACLLETLSVGSAGASTAAGLSAAAAGWIEAFAAVARSAGASPALATARAQDAVAAIEGGLILARVTGDAGAFRRALARLGDLLLGDA